MKRLRFSVIGLSVLTAVLLLTSIYLLIDRNSYKTSLSLEEKANTALYNNAGRMCSVLSSTDAAAELQAAVSVEAASYPAGFAKAIEQSDYYPLIDSCRYIGQKNNTRYMNFVGQRYNTVDEAKSDFNLQKQVLMETEPLDAKPYNLDEMFYYGGAIFARQGEVMFSVSVNKPEISGAELQAYAQKVFDQTYQNMLTLL